MQKEPPRDAQHQEGHPRAGLGPSDAPFCLIGYFRVSFRIVFSGSKAKTRRPLRLSPPLRFSAPSLRFAYFPSCFLYLLRLDLRRFSYKERLALSWCISFVRATQPSTKQTPGWSLNRVDVWTIPSFYLFLLLLGVFKGMIQWGGGLSGIL